MSERAPSLFPGLKKFAASKIKKDRLANWMRRHPKLAYMIWGPSAVRAITGEDKRGKTRKIVSEAGPVAVGTGISYLSLPLLLGKKRLYHGTSQKAWNKIKKEGLDPRYGGTKPGGAAAEGVKQWEKGSKGVMHLGGYLDARGYARMVGERSTGRTPSLLEGYFLGPGKHGKIITIYLPYEKSLARVPGRLLERLGLKQPKQSEFSEIIMNTIRGVKKLKPVFGADPTYPGVIRTRVHIQPKYFGQKALFGSLGKLPKYIMEHPIRFGVGAAGVPAGLALIANAVIRSKKILEGKDKKRV